MDARGNVLATLHSNRVNLRALEGQFVTVCGFSEGRIEGVVSLNVTQVFSASPPIVTPPPPQPQPINIDLQTLLLLLLLANLFGFGQRRTGGTI